MSKFVKVNVEVVKEISAIVLDSYPNENSDTVEKYVSFHIARLSGDDILENDDILKCFEDACDLQPEVAGFCEKLVNDKLEGRVN